MLNKSTVLILLSLFFVYCNQTNNSTNNKNNLEVEQEKKVENSVDNFQNKGFAKGKLRYYADAFTFTFCDKENPYFVKPDKGLLAFEKIILNIDKQYIFIEANYLIEEIINEDGLLSKQITLEDIQQIEKCE